jgi:membrane protease YdiL (CAAX protease family)
MKTKKNLKFSILLFFGYIAYLLLERPINLILEKFSLSLLHQGFLSNLTLLLPLLILITYLLYKLNHQNKLTSKTKKIYLIPIAYLLFTIAMSFSIFENAVSVDFVVFVFGLCLVGFTEEFLFRGIIFPNLSSAFSSIYIGAITSSFLFGIGHYINLISIPKYINEITFQVISAFCIGILMCGILYKTKNLIVPALIHTIFNLNSLIRAFTYLRSDPKLEIKNKEVFHPTIWELLNQELMFNLACLTIGFALLYYQNKKETRKITTGNNVYKT